MTTKTTKSATAAVTTVAKLSSRDRHPPTKPATATVTTPAKLPSRDRPPKSGATSRTKRKRERNRERPKPVWDCLPDLLLEDIFSMLSIRDRYYASQVCHNWNRIFYSPRVWNTFVLGDRTLTRRKFNYYMGYQYVLDHHRTQICLHRMGKGFRRIIINPMENFFNLYEFMTIVSYFCEFFEDQPLNLVRSLDFTFACDSATAKRDTDEVVFGTGGKLLQALKRMMGNLTGLKHLSLQDLLLDKEEAMYLLDDVVHNCCQTLSTLKLVNCTKEPYPILHAGVFLNLRKLVISPQQIGEDVIMLLGYTKLRDLYLLQTKYTDHVTPVPAKVWKDCRKQSPYLRVHLVVEGKVKTEVVWQEGAPVRSVIYDSCYARISVPSVLTCTGLYHQDLEVYAFLGLPRFYMPRPFQDRADSALVLISRSCPRLDTLVIRERISTSTVLLLAYYCPNMRRLIVRRNALIKKCDWPQNPEWTDEFYIWLRNTSKSYEATADEVSLLLGIRWSPLSDREFKAFRL